MHKINKVQLNIWLPKTLRDQLRVEAARQILTDPSEKISASSLAVDIISRYFENLNE